MFDRFRQAGHPAPNPSPSRGGGFPATAFAAIVVGLLLLQPSAAFASEGIGGTVDPSIYRLMVFAMAIFVGYYVVWSVTPALHTPLMAVTNAISSVIVVGALLAVGVDGVMSGSLAARFFGFLALMMASVNIFGGFLVTNRMLSMYKKKEAPQQKTDAK